MKEVKKQRALRFTESDWQLIVQAAKKADLPIQGYLESLAVSKAKRDLKK